MHPDAYQDATRMHFDTQRYLKGHVKMISECNGCLGFFGDDVLNRNNALFELFDFEYKYPPQKRR
jgi:hypothetical protein